MSGNSTHLNAIRLNEVGSYRPGEIQGQGQVSSAARKWHSEPLDKFSSG